MNLRFALRQLRQSPGFAAVTILSLALGIGANTAIFSVVNGMLLKRLPVEHPEQLVLFNWAASDGVGPRSHSGHSQTIAETGERTSTSFSLATYEHFRAPGQTLTDVFAFSPLWQVNAIYQGQAENLRTAAMVSGNYHQALGVRLQLGRGLTAADDEPGATPVAVISHRYWQNRFGGSATILNETLTLNGVPFAIAGVTAPGFNGTGQVGEVQDVFVPLNTYRLLEPGDTEAYEPWAWGLRIMGRMAHGATMDQVNAEMAGRFAASYEGHLEIGENQHMRLRTESGATGLNEERREYSASLRVLAAIVGLVLLVACANVANLLLARGAARERELAVRIALGASRPRLIGQLLTESLLLSFLGAALGLLLSLWARDAFLALRPFGGSGFTVDLSLDWRVLGFTAAVAGLTGVLFGTLPALRATRRDVVQGFQGGHKALGAPRSALAKALMILQIALSLVLLIGAGLFSRTLTNLAGTHPGFERDGLLLFSLDAMPAGYEREQLDAVYTRVRDRLATLPGVENAAFSRVPLLSGGRWTSTRPIEGHAHTPELERTIVMNGVSPDFLDTMRWPLLLGRNLTAADSANAPRVILVNQAFATKFFPGENAIGRRIGSRDDNLDTEIVGVVADGKYANLREEQSPAAFLPHAQIPNARAGHFALRFRGSDAALRRAVTDAVHELEPQLPVIALRTQHEQIDRLLGEERLFATLSAVFGGLALGLAAIGLYGLLAFAVVRRTGEIGLRMALGALPSGVRWLILRDSLLLATSGIVLGLVAAAGLMRLVSNQLYGLTAFDPTIYTVSALVLLGVSLLAAFLPAHRATRVDPMVALRSE